MKPQKFTFKDTKKVDLGTKVRGYFRIKIKKIAIVSFCAVVGKDTIS